MFLVLGDLKYTYQYYTKENQRTHTKKEEKMVNMFIAPTSLPKLQRSATKKRYYVYITHSTKVYFERSNEKDFIVAIREDSTRR